MLNIVSFLSRRFRAPALKSFRFFEGDASAPVVTPETPPTRRPLPLITSRELQYKRVEMQFTEPRQAWLCNMDTVEEEKLGLLDLHPEVFAVMPRIDLMYMNVRWQTKYKQIDFKTELSRAECKGGGRKPWPQKGTGRARHGSIRSPIFNKGGKAHGKRGPKTKFYMLNVNKRLWGLISSLTCKLAQDDLVIVDSLDIPTDQPSYIEDLIASRKWGLSVLFVNHLDVMPRNITLATDKMEAVGLMPYYGLNVFSMLKFDTLVLTLEALNKIEERILFHLYKSDANVKFDRMHIPDTVPMNST